MPRRRSLEAIIRWTAWAPAAAAVVAGALGAPRGQAPSRNVEFAREIEPVLRAKCGICHGQDAQSAGLRLDTPEGLRKGGASGPLWSAGRGRESLIVRRLRGERGMARMPMNFAPLPEAFIEKLAAWIDQGASFGALKPAKHWAYAPPRRPALPAVANKAWTRNPIDLFVLDRLEKHGLRPSPEASREALCRRVYLDLTGLPPSVEEMDAFLADKRAGAYERMVDRLLASPHYGEKMARQWLDLARFADTNGYEKDLPRSLWPWRDWVIRAFNQNMPFDRFTIEQLAGDLLPKPTQDQLVATGFHRNSMLNDEGGIDPEEFRVVAVKDRVDATALTWLGTTLACAECHDHKYDPFTQRDYYRLYAFFNQSEDNGRDMDPMLKTPTEEQRREMERIGGALAEARQDLIDRTPSALAGLSEWEGRVTRGWSVRKPLSWTAQATLTSLEDGSLLASGPDPVQDEYVVVYPALTGVIAGVRIEALPHPSLPHGSSGRNVNGNFVLRRLEAWIEPAGGDSALSRRELRFVLAQADFSQGGHDPMSVIREGDGEGWAIAGFLPEQRRRHALVLKLAEPLPTGEGDRLVVRYVHQSKHANHNLGRLRLSLTADVELAGMRPPTEAVHRALETSADQRAEPQAESLRQFFLSVTPELAEARERIADLERREREIDARIPTTMIMRELKQPRPSAVLKRGDFRSPGAFVLPATPPVLGGWSTRSDRLGLARWLVDSKNPLTARVQVNRLWAQCFGRGIVATPEDFGTQGEPPSHPQLLDWLAVQFMESGWDVKAMMRLIVTSATYRQSSAARPGATKGQDPENELLSRGPRFRVGAEEVRDIALAASGRLTRATGGPSVFPPQPPGIWENSFTFYDTKDRWVEDEGPNRYRRGIYTFWRRTAPHPMALNFDLKSRDTCIPRRSRTNTPLQALNTLNDPLFVECAGALGARMASFARANPSAGEGKGVELGFRSCVGRRPRPAELGTLSSLLEAARARFEGDPQSAASLLKAARVEVAPGMSAEIASWVVVANALLNLDESLIKG